MGGLVYVLESAPPADIEDQNGVECALLRQGIAEKLLERVSALQREAALSSVDI